MIVALQIALAAFIVLLAAWGSFVALRSLYRKYINKKAMSPLNAKNKEKEEQFLNKLLEDVRKNTNEWFIVDEGYGSANTIVNDHKNIGIVYNDGEAATIMLNLNELSKFDKQDEDTVKIQIMGSHMREFIKAAETIIDRRGNELAFFESELEKRI